MFSLCDLGFALCSLDLDVLCALRISHKLSNLNLPTNQRLPVRRTTITCKVDDMGVYKHNNTHRTVHTTAAQCTGPKTNFQIYARNGA